MKNQRKKYRKKTPCNYWTLQKKQIKLSLIEWNYQIYGLHCILKSIRLELNDLEDRYYRCTTGGHYIEKNIFFDVQELCYNSILLFNVSTNIAWINDEIRNDAAFIIHRLESEDGHYTLSCHFGQTTFL